jgi:hypothetical protein
MSNNEKRKIHVVISGMRIPLIINNNDEEEEEQYRNAEKLVKTFLKDYREKYSRRTNEELLILTAFKTAVLLAKHDLKANSSTQQSDMKSLNDELDKLLDIS